VGKDESNVGDGNDGRAESAVGVGINDGRDEREVGDGSNGLGVAKPEPGVELGSVVLAGVELGSAVLAGVGLDAVGIMVERNGMTAGCAFAGAVILTWPPKS
jgi:hypothetical protein